MGRNMIKIHSVSATNVTVTMPNGRLKSVPWWELRDAAVQTDADLAVPYHKILVEARRVAADQRLAGWCVEIDSSEGKLCTPVKIGSPPHMWTLSAQETLTDLRADRVSYLRAFGHEARAKALDEQMLGWRAYGTPRIVVVDADEMADRDRCDADRRKLFSEARR